MAATQNPQNNGKQVQPADLAVRKSDPNQLSNGKSAPLEKAPGADLSKLKTHNGFPVLTMAAFQALYSCQSHPGEVQTFDFRGYVEDETGKLMYMDVLATNGLRGGIHVGIDGTTSYDDISSK